MTAYPHEFLLPDTTVWLLNKQSKRVTCPVCAGTKEVHGAAGVGVDTFWMTVADAQAACAARNEAEEVPQCATPPPA